MFDASKIYDTVPLSALPFAEKRLNGMQNPLSLALNKKLLQQELYQIEYRCNMTAWGQHSIDLPAPTEDQGAELLKRLSSPAFIRDAIDAVSIRYVLNGLDDVHRRDRAKHEKEWEQANAAETEKRDREAFDAHETSQREKRFLQWRSQPRAHRHNGD